MTDIHELLAIGDSVVWGQGLNHDDKFASIVYENLTGETLPASDIKARSGAIIGYTGEDGEMIAGLEAEAAERPPITSDAVGGRTARHEVPNAFPTIFQQIESTGRDSEPGIETAEVINRDEAESTDLVILDGGANDIDVLEEALLPWKSQHALEELARQHFHTEMREVVATAREKFPNAIIVVTGYFPILTEDTNVAAWESFFKWLFLASGSGIGSIPPAALASTLARMVDNAVHFHRRQLYWLRKAVTETGADPQIRGPGLLFAHAGYRKRNGMWADEAWVFSPHDDDAVKDIRAQACGAVFPNEGAVTDLDDIVDGARNAQNRSFCEIAATGHPNELGASAYAESILARLAEADRPSLRNPLSELAESTSISLRTALERYRLDPGEGIRANLAHTVIDCIHVKIHSGDIGTESEVYLRVGDGGNRRYLLNGKRAKDPGDDIEFGEHSIHSYVIDPVYDTDDTTPLRLWDITELTLEKEGAGNWDIDGIEVEINGRKIVDDDSESTLSGDATRDHQYPVSAAV